MSDKELAKALLDLATPQPTTDELRAQTERVLSRDRRRVKVLGLVTAVLWGMSAIAVYMGIFSVLQTFQDFRDNSPSVEELSTKVLEILLGVAAGIESIVFALLSTIILLVFSRRATLRQINVSLQQISSEIRQYGTQPADGR